MHKTKVVTLLAAAQRTATATGSAVATGSVVKPITGDQEGFSRHATVILVATAGAAGTMDLTVEGSADNSNWVTLTASAAWTQVTTTAGTFKQSRRYDGPLPPFIRAVGTAATSPDHTYSVVAVLGG